MARIHAVVRRAKGYAHSVIEAGKLKLDLNTKIVTISDQEVPLTGKHYLMLELLLLRKGTIVTPEMFLDYLYGGLDEPSKKNIGVLMWSLRRRLGRVSEETAWCVDTVWGRGYIYRDSMPSRTISIAAE